VDRSVIRSIPMRRIFAPTTTGPRDSTRIARSTGCVRAYLPVGGDRLSVGTGAMQGPADHENHRP
jgi:hypothetical protein